LEDNWYTIGGKWVGGITSVVTFFGCWIYCTATYGFLFGFGLGWIPSIIAASIAGVLAGLLWPFLLLGVVIMAFAIFGH
jgi:hypothetical protein